MSFPQQNTLTPQQMDKTFELAIVSSFHDAQKQVDSVLEAYKVRLKAADTIAQNYKIEITRLQEILKKNKIDYSVLNPTPPNRAERRAAEKKQKKKES